MRVLIFFPVLLVALSSSCATKKKAISNDQLLGAPPTEKEDPFFFVTLPANARKVEAQGTIGASEGSAEPARPEEKQTRIQCFSCVKICDKYASCDEGDTICGWGVHPEQIIAAGRAEAECEGALDIARHDPRWKKIDGKCPVATCKE